MTRNIRTIFLNRTTVENYKIKNYIIQIKRLLFKYFININRFERLSQKLSFHRVDTMAQNLKTNEKVFSLSAVNVNFRDSLINMTIYFSPLHDRKISVPLQ